MTRYLWSVSITKPFDGSALNPHNVACLQDNANAALHIDLCELTRSWRFCQFFAKGVQCFARKHLAIISHWRVTWDHLLLSCAEIGKICCGLSVPWRCKKVLCDHISKKGICISWRKWLLKLTLRKNVVKCSQLTYCFCKWTADIACTYMFVLCVRLTGDLTKKCFFNFSLDFWLIEILVYFWSLVTCNLCISYPS